MLTEEDKKLAEEFGIADYEEAIIVDLLAQYYETLNLRVAMAVEDKLTDEQLLEFEKVQEAGDDKATEDWLKLAIGGYDKLVADEAEAVKADIKRTFDSIDKAASEE